jgi:hypothetical protein
MGYGYTIAFLYSLQLMLIYGKVWYRGIGKNYIKRFEIDILLKIFIVL